ncbi:MAG: hypothetical protein ATN31_05235 [Candidatus Epulonipiscioides saccharophilum]|nr:MAG: hypothetical protein ATN31_05235 [Epulopiscium sp. AS2M-Bin001]
MELLSPTMDFIFKKIFGDEKNKDTLIDFLNKDPNSAKAKKLGGPINKAMDILTELSGDEKVRKTYFERHRILMEENSALNKARKDSREEGRKEGIEEGMQKGIEKTAIAFLDLLEDDVIALKTGLDIESIRNLRKANKK